MNVDNQLVAVASLQAWRAAFVTVGSEASCIMLSVFKFSLWII